MILNPASNVVITPPYSDVFADNTWEQIIAACQANQVPDTWVADGSWKVVGIFVICVVLTCLPSWP